MHACIHTHTPIHIQSEFLSDEQLNEIQEAFRVFDKKGENQISGNDLVMVFQALNCNVNQAEIAEYMEVCMHT